MGLCKPNFDFCIINCANVHRIPLVIDAKIKNMKPSVLNCVDLYVNKQSPDDIRTTINISSQLCRENKAFHWKSIEFLFSASNKGEKKLPSSLNQIKWQRIK